MTSASKNFDYDVAVIGGGHAGVEAAAAAARLGAKTALFTFSKSNLGELSCNPSIGGLGKGHLVREIDALDGVMPVAADMASIGYRTLNSSKGAAVQGLRAQVDRELYKSSVSKILDSYKNLEVIEGEITSLDQVNAKSIVITTGTFLNGVMHIGEEKTEGGRIGEPPSKGITAELKRLGFKISRLKTGTPARLAASSINWSVLDRQEDDTEHEFFSTLTTKPYNETRLCHLAATNAKTHEIIVAAKDRTPLYNGQIKGVGPRYCPSIEDKVVRFAHHSSHHVFLEPEGLTSDVIYPNGVSTSLPRDVQEKFLKSIKGLENVEIIRYGYAIEYDSIDPRELSPALQSLRHNNLFFAGQINGTSGYEEAAAQGVIAGINAALFAAGKPPFITDRAESFIGVLIDDITTLGVDEPYRMFTARSEYRLSLRQDNADKRLTPRGVEIGVVSRTREKSFIKKMQNPSQKQKDIEKKYAGYLKRQAIDMDSFRRDASLKLPPDLEYKKISGLTLELAGKLDKSKPATLASAARIQGITPAALTILLKYAN